MAEFSIRKGDLLPPLLMTLVPAQGQSFDLVGCTVRLRLWAKSQPAPKVNDALCTVVNPLTLKVRYDWQPGDTDTAEGYLGVVLVTFPGGAVETFPNTGPFIVRVTP